MLRRSPYLACNDSLLPTVSTVLTRKLAESIAFVHNRTPVILPSEGLTGGAVCFRGGAESCAGYRSQITDICIDSGRRKLL